MKKIYLNHIPWNIHPVYQEMFDNPPEWIEYINKDDFWTNYQNTILNIKWEWFLDKIKKLILSIVKKYYFLPNITFKKLSWDLIYSCQSIPLYWDYILDLDCYEWLNRFSNKISSNFLNKLIVKKLLKRKNCKKIIFWSDNAKIWFQSYLWNIFDYKIEVIYPAIKVNHTIDDILNWKDKKNINILFVWRYFERKWWMFFLEAANQIIWKYNNINFYIISDVDINIIKKYKNEKINFLWLLSRNETLDYFKKADIYLMPTFYDIFWMVFLEAFAYWAISISMNTFWVNNIIDNWNDWFVIDYKNKFHTDKYKYIDKYNQNLDFLLEKVYEEKDYISKEIVDKLLFLINNREVKNKFMLNWFEKVKKGKFSIEFKNALISEILYVN